MRGWEFCSLRTLLCDQWEMWDRSAPQKMLKFPRPVFHVYNLWLWKNLDLFSIFFLAEFLYSFIRNCVPFSSSAVTWDTTPASTGLSGHSCPLSSTWSSPSTRVWTPSKTPSRTWMPTVTSSAWWRCTTTSSARPWSSSFSRTWVIWLVYIPPPSLAR